MNQGQQIQDLSNYVFKKDFPRLGDYKNMETLRAKFESLSEVNNQAFNPDTVQNAIFFVIKSTNDDDIHKAIKYGLWTSSQKNNEILSKTWQEAQKNSQDIYLFYSVVKSGQFCGVAKMSSDFDAGQSLDHWWEELKWFGSFRIKWI